jgi:hypothetical protein
VGRSRSLLTSTTLSSKWLLGNLPHLCRTSDQQVRAGQMPARSAFKKTPFTPAQLSFRRHLAQCFRPKRIDSCLDRPHFTIPWVFRGTTDFLSSLYL